MGRLETLKVLAATMLGTMDTNALVPIIALYASFRGADLLQVGIIVGLYSAVHAPANLLFGRLADRWGRRRPLNLGLLWDALSVFLYAFAMDPWTLALVRLSHGLGGGLVGPSSMSLIADTAAPGRKGRAMAVYGMSLAVAVVVGFGIAGPIVHELGYAALFYLLAGGLLIGAGISLTIQEPQRPRTRAPFDLSSFVRRVRRPEALAGYAGIFGLYFALGAFVALVPLFLQATLGYGALEVGLSFFTFALLSLLLHYPAGILADRFGAAVPALMGLLAAAAAMAAIPFARGLAPLLLLMALFGVGHGFVFPSTSALVTRGTDPETMGVAAGLFYALLVAGVAIGAPAMAAVAYPSDYALGMTASALAPLGAVVLVARGLRWARVAPPRAGDEPLEDPGNP